MKILVMTGEYLPFRGGIGTYAKEIATAAAELGHEVELIAPDYGQDQSALDADAPIRIRRFSAGVPSFRELPIRIVTLLKTVIGRKYDVIHAVDWPFYIPLYISKFFQRKADFIATVHGTEIYTMSSPIKRSILNVMGFWRADWVKWIANSHFTLHTLRTYCPKSARRSVAIPLGVSDSWINARPNRCACRRSYGVPDDRFVIVSVGRLVARKGHLDLATALSRLDAQIQSKIDWWIVGSPIDKGYFADLKRATDHLHITTRYFEGLNDEEVQKRIASADLFALPGYQDKDGKVEGFGLVFLEAAAYGIPSLATNSGGIPDAIEHEKTGILVGERDISALHLALEKLINDRNYLDQLGSQAAERAAQMTWRHIASATYERS